MARLGNAMRRKARQSKLCFVQSGNLGLRRTLEVIDVSDSEMSFILLFSLLMTDTGLWAMNQQLHAEVSRCQTPLLTFP